VSAIFYLYISLEFLEGITVDGVQRGDAEKLGEIITIVVWFLAICSIVSPGPLPLIMIKMVNRNFVVFRKPLS